MKKLLLPLFALTPALVCAQDLGGSPEVIGIFVGLAIMIGLFFLFRGLMLWYWKENNIVKNQEESNRLLKAVVRNLESKNDNIKDPKKLP